MRIQGADALQRKLGAIPKAVEQEVRRAMALGADEAVAMIDRLAPAPLKGRTRWTWGPPPRASRALIAVGEDGSSLQLTIFMEYRGTGFEDARAHWFEFGTGERVQKTTGRRTGRMPATPFFYPGFRLVRARARNRIARAMRKAIREVAAR